MNMVDFDENYKPHISNEVPMSRNAHRLSIFDDDPYIIMFHSWRLSSLAFLIPLVLVIEGDDRQGDSMFIAGHGTSGPVYLQPRFKVGER